MKESWTKKYMPKKLSEVVGQKTVISKVLAFVRAFPATKKRAFLLWGSVGVGKTCISHALAKEHNYEIIELNASNFRDKETVKEILGAATQQASLFGSKKIILIDEIDRMSGRGDRGGVAAIISVIKDTKFPILLTANDPFSQKLKTLRRHCTLMELKGVSYLSILNRLEQICKAEQIEYESSALKKLALAAGGDLRAAINDLQMIAETRKALTEKEIKLWSREREESIFNVLKIIFKSFDTASAMKAVYELNEELETLIYWLDQNLPAEYHSAAERALAYNFLSDANIFLTRIRRWQHWRFISYAQALAVLGVQQAKESANPKFILHQRPELLLKLYIRAAKQRKIKGISRQVSHILHASSYTLTKSFWPYYEFIQEKNQQVAEEINEFLGF